MAAAESKARGTGLTAEAPRTRSPEIYNLRFTILDLKTAPELQGAAALKFLGGTVGSASAAISIPFHHETRECREWPRRGRRGAGRDTCGGRGPTTGD